MTGLHIALTLVAILLFVAVLAFFLFYLALQLSRVDGLLGQIDSGLKVVSSDTGAIGPAADAINANLRDAAAGLSEAVSRAEQLAAR